MPRNNNMLLGLAVLALAFATGAEALVCSANQYLSYSTASPPVLTCSACPSANSIQMTNQAGVAGGYGDSADPRIAIKVLAAASGSILTYCNVPAGAYLASSTSGTLIGTAMACPAGAAVSTAKTTSVEEVITGSVSFVSEAAGAGTMSTRCSMKSTCAANEYLSAPIASAGVVSVTLCTACPGGMTSLAGSAQPTQSLIVTAIQKEDAGNTLLVIGTYCNVKAGSYLSAVVGIADIGAAADCTNTGIYSKTTSEAQQLAASATYAWAAVSSVTDYQEKRCTQKSLCAVNEYLSKTATHSVVCTACPSGMTAPVGASQPAQDYISAGVIATTAGIIVGTYCNVPSGHYLSTGTTAALIGAATACPDSYSATRSLATTITPLVGSTGVTQQNEWAQCLVENNINGAAGSGGAAGSASPASPLSTVTAAVFGAVVPAILILV